jgi:RNA polymerase sigma factor (sigma-70 family)
VDVPETELVRRAQGGDATAFEALVLAHQTLAYNLALRALGDEREAEDAAQEAFVRAWLALPNFRGQARFGTWLYRIVTNLCCNRHPRFGVSCWRWVMMPPARSRMSHRNRPRQWSGSRRAPDVPPSSN